MPVVLAGDYNVVPTDIDIYPTTSWDNDALLQPESRARLSRASWTRAGPTRCATLHPDEPIYTFWHYLRHRWPRDAGLAHRSSVAQPALAPRLVAAGVDRDIRGEEGASDHAPVWIELDMPKRRTRRR